ncbi:ABC transporter substrate-binding protein [Piscinibacter sakaiensis]|uniref:Alkanesulfonates-binding protein n=1 Tax=Piscinibacter sakaiensis TaxID=1547922 RepID=A0A0K8P4L9_PISS1|nr:ABC transporter substrate-binding protein [Piscinibacter sakaiensis]GAP37469.1 alkanesulfonates-binding protein [Piscinibacter sakaiensis]
MPTPRPSAWRRRVVALACAAGVMATAAVPAAAQAPTPIKISYQIAYWALPIYVATEKNWWAEAGLKPEFVVYPAGAQQIAGAPSKSWDVGGTGSPPAVLGAQRYDIVTIGITNDESATNAVVARKDKLAAIKANPAKELKGQQILLSPNSTGEYATMACLRKWGLQRSDVGIVTLAPAQLVSAYTGGNGMLAGTWAPNTYTLNEQIGAEVICSGKDAGALVLGALIARKEFAQQNPDAVARFLAVYLRAVNYQKNNRAEFMASLRKFFEVNGIKLKDAYLSTEMERPIYPLDEQLRLLSRASGPSTADGAFEALSGYLKSVGTLSEVPDPKGYITDQYLKALDANPTLKAFANKAQ